MSQPPARPSAIQSLTELPRAGGELLRLVRNAGSLVQQSPRGKGQIVLSLPGYGASDGAMAGLRLFLRSLGYRPKPIGLGRNFEPPEQRIKSVDDAIVFRDCMVEKIAERVQAIYEQERQPVSLVGWSMGGCYAVDVAHQLADKVDKVITLGSPFGDPRGTALWNVMRWLSRSDVPIEDQNFEKWNERQQISVDNVDFHVLYSQNDGIVSTDIARLSDSDNVTHWEVESTHLGFAYNEGVYRQVALALAS